MEQNVVKISGGEGEGTIFEKSLNASLVEHCLESYLNGLSQIHIDRLTGLMYARKI